MNMDRFELSLQMISNMEKVMKDWQSNGDPIKLKKVMMKDYIDRFESLLNEIISEEDAKKETI